MEQITEVSGKELLFPKRKKYQPALKKRKLPNSRIVDTYIRNKFHVTNTCKALKISVETWYRWMDEYPLLKHQTTLAKESIKDNIEQALLGKAQEGDTQLLLYLAKTLLRDRGYGSETQTQQQTNTQVNIVLPEDTTKKYEWWGSQTKPDESK